MLDFLESIVNQNKSYLKILNFTGCWMKLSSSKISLWRQYVSLFATN